MRFRDTEWPKVIALLAVVIAAQWIPGAHAGEAERYWQELCQRNEIRVGDCPALKVTDKPLHGLLPSWLECGRKSCTVLLWDDAPDRSAALLRRINELRSRSKS